MANKGTIDEIVDPKSYAQLEKLQSMFVDVRGELIGFTKDIKSFNSAIGDAKTIKQFEDAVNKNNKALSEMGDIADRTKKIAVDAEIQKQKAIEATAKKLEKEAKENKTLEKTITDRTKVEKALQDLEAKGLGQKEQLIGKIIEQKLELSELSNQEKQLNKDFAAGSVTSSEYTKKLTALTVQQDRLKLSVQGDAQAVSRLTKEEQAQSGSVDQLRAKLGSLTGAYNGLSKAERENKDVGGLLLKQIKETDQEVKNTAESTGNFRDSVGNYAKGLSGPLAGAVQGVEMLGGAMFALPLAAVAAGLYGVYQALLLNDDAANRVQGAFLGLKTVTSNAANAFVGFLNKVKESETASNALSAIGEGAISAIPGVKLLQLAFEGIKKSQGEVFAASNQYVVGMDAIEFSTNKASVAISENELKIQRLATISKEATLSGKERLAALDEQSKIEAQSTAISLGQIDAKIFLENKLLAVQTNNGEIESVLAEETQFRIFALQAERNDRLREQEALETSQQKRRISLAKEIAAEEKKIIDDQFNLEKQRLEFQRDAQKAIVDDTTQSLEVRLAAEGVFYARQQSLLDLSLKHDLAELELSDTKKTQINEKYKNDSEKNEKERVKNINKIATDSYRQAEEEFGKSLSRKEKKRLEALQNDLLRIETARDNELANVKGNTKEAADERIAIEKRYTLLYIDEQLTQVEAAIAAQKAIGISVEKEEAEAAALRRKRNEASISDDAKTLKTREQKIAEFYQITGQITAQAFELAQALSNNLYQSQIRAITEIENKNTKRYDQEKEQIENSTLSESEKKVKLEILDKKKAFQDAQIAEKKKQADLAAAKRDRDIKIAQIIANTALAVLAQLSIPGAGFALAAAAAAIGALQIATVLATPLPAYEHGGVVSETGPAIVSEKGRELVYEPDGTMWVTPDSESVVSLNKGARVIPHPESERIMAGQTLSHQITNKYAMDVNKITSSYDANTRKVVGAINKKSPIVTERNGIVTYKTAS